MNRLTGFSIIKKKSDLLKFFIVAVALLFLLAILNISISPVRNYFYILSSPIQKSFWLAGESAAGFFGSLFKAGFFQKENESLKRQNQQLLSQLSFLQAVVDGNRAQSDISTFCQNNELTHVMAGVIGLEDGDMISINKGSADGISEGMPVINEEGVLFGKVFKVYKNFASVMLVSNKSSVINVNVAALPEIDGVVKGDGGLVAHLDLIPIDLTINEQDVLVTSSIEKLFPKDLLVGRIVKKEKNDQQPFQQAEIALFFDLKSADNLFVITNYKR